MDTGRIENFGINLNEFEMVKIILSKNFAKQIIAKITLSKNILGNFIGPFFKLPLSFLSSLIHLKYH